MAPYSTNDGLSIVTLPLGCCDSPLAFGYGITCDFNALEYIGGRALVSASLPDQTRIYFTHRFFTALNISITFQLTYTYLDILG